MDEKATIEQAVIAFLEGALDVPAYGETPSNPPDLYIIVERTGGAPVDHLDKATLAVRSCAPSLYQAAILDTKVRGAMVLDLIAAPWISGVSLNSHYPYTDTATKQRRYQAVFDISYYEEEIPNGDQ